MPETLSDKLIRAARIADASAGHIDPASLKALADEARELEKKLAVAQYTEPLEGWVIASVDFEHQDDTGDGNARPAYDGYEGWYADVVLYEEDGYLRGLGRGSKLADAMKDAIRVARGGELSDE